MKAVAFFDDKIKGSIEFKQPSSGSPVLIHFNLSGFEPRAIHAIHIHEFGDVRQGCKSLGGHFNPTNKQHSHSQKGHAGDLFNNFQTDNKGNFVYTMKTPQLSLFYGVKCILGRSVVIHAFADDYGLQGQFIQGQFIAYNDMTTEQLKQICQTLGYDEYKKTRKDMVNRLNKESITTGNASTRIACAIVGISG